MHRYFSLPSFFLSVLLVGLSSPCFANEIIVKDTAGYTRAVSPVEEFGSVEFSLVSNTGAPADGVEVLLTNTTTGESLSAVSANGTVVFEGIETGTWTVASTVPDVTFTSVQINSAAALGGAGLAAGSGALGGLGGASAAAVGVGAVGAGAIAISEANGDSNAKRPDSPLSPFR